MFFGSLQNISRLDGQSKFQTFTLNIYRPPYWRTKVVRRTFRRISQFWDNAQTLNVEKCLLQFSSIISQFLDFIHCIVLDFIFHCVTMHILYSLRDEQTKR